MTEHETFPGKPYVVTSKAGCTITDASGELEETCEPGKQKVVHAPSEKLFTSAPAIVRETFNRAASALRLLGGGVKSDLPAGYLRAEFLESTGSQYIDTFQLPTITTEFYLDCYYNVPVSPIINGTIKAGQCILGMRLNRAYEWRYMITNYNTNNRGYAAFGHNRRAASTQEGINRYQFSYKNSVFSTNGESSVVDISEDAPKDEIRSNWSLHLFRGNYVDEGNKDYTQGRVYNLKIWRDKVLRLSFTPALDPQGKPCMYDKASKEEFVNVGSGAFVAGFTLEQARKLGEHLPADGGALTISLPTGYEQDSAVAESLETARAKGWTLTVQTYEAEAAATTFGMRRVWVRRTQTAQGAYVDADGVRWAVEWCVDMLTPDGSTPDQHGYELYRSTAAAVAYWELQAWVAPEAEREFLTTEEQ